MGKKLPITELHQRIKAYLNSVPLEYDIIYYDAKRHQNYAYSFFGSRVQILINPAGGGDTIDYIDFDGTNFDEILEWFKSRLRFHGVL